MKLLKTCQIQIMEEKEKIHETVDTFLEAMNYVSQYARKKGVYSKNKIQSQLYYDIRQRFGLKSQMAINSIRDVVTQYKGDHRKNRHRTDQNGDPQAVEFKSRSMRLNYPRDYRLKDENVISLNSLHGRLKVKYQIGDFQQTLLDGNTWEVRSSMLSIRYDGVILLNITVQREIPETSFLNKDGVVGVDLGMNFIAVTTDTNEHTEFYGGGKIKYKRWLFAKQRQEAQSKGTRSSKRFLRRIRRRERRFVTDSNHCIAKDIVSKALQRFKSPIIAMEDLKGIRQQKYLGKAQKTQLNKWAFYQLQQFIEYKALENNIPIIYIDPKYTSQMCPKCGHTERSNRDRKTHRFQCKKCGYQSNDDRSASINIRDRAVVPRYIRDTRGMCQLPSCVVK